MSDIDPITADFRLLTVREVAELLSVGIQTVYRATQNEGLPTVRIGKTGGSVRIRERDLLNWLDRNTDRGQVAA